MKYYRIGFVGSGNLAWHLAQDLEKAGHYIPVIYSRNEESASLLANQLYDTQVGESLDFTSYQLDVLILAVKDDAIAEVADQLVLEADTIVVHSSGLKPMETLSILEDNYGVFYPVQTFTKERAIDFSEIPICIESDNTRVHEVLFHMGKSLSQNVLVMESRQRQILHLSAVFANNFTNHMLFWAQNILETEDINFQLLNPLAKETIRKAFDLGPEKAQTGPARRNDLGTLQVHESLIEGNPELLALYKILSKSLRINS